MRKRWSRDELFVALYLYCELPFGQFDQRNKSIIHFSKALGRTPSSLAMKLCNFASLDPVITSTGRKGLKGASSLDRELWEEMNQDWEAFASTVETLLSQLPGSEPVEKEKPTQLEVTEVSSFTKVRLGQSLFRKSVMSAYGGKCCISGVSNSELLVASHIVPWSVNQSHRLNPRNGLCLSVLHDKAFDRGIITLDEDFSVIVSESYKQSKNEFIRNSLVRYDGKQIAMPEKFTADQKFLAYHRENIYRSN